MCYCAHTISLSSCHLVRDIAIRFAILADAEEPIAETRPVGWSRVSRPRVFISLLLYLNHKVVLLHVTSRHVTLWGVDRPVDRVGVSILDSLSGGDSFT